MKTAVLRSFRFAPIAALFALPLIGNAAPNPASPPAEQLLARHGRITIDSVGRFVSHGTFRIQVAAKLGSPDARLDDGTWLYHHRRIDGSDAEGTLVIGFTEGRVHSLSLVTPTVAAAMLKRSPKTAAPEFVAAR